MKYVVLLLVILFGVAGGNLIANWAQTQIDAYRTETKGQTPKGARTGAAPLQEPSRIPLAGEIIRSQQEQARDQRRRDRDGVRLGQTCQEWRQANAQLNSATTASEMKRHCGVYERYVQDGVLPGK